MKENPFTFCHDGSSDNSIKKMNPTIFDINNSKTHSHVYIITGEDCGKAEKMFEAI